MSSLSHLVIFFRLQPNTEPDRVLISRPSSLRVQQCEIDAQENTAYFMQRQRDLVCC